MCLKFVYMEKKFIFVHIRLGRGIKNGNDLSQAVATKFV